MKFYISADYHLRLTNSCGVMQEGMNSRLRDEIKILSDMVNNAISNKIDVFIILGDIFDKINPGEKLRRLFVDTVIAPLMKNRISVIILMGNHDTNFDVVSFETEVALLDSVQEGLLTLIREPQIIDFGECRDYFVPFGFPIPKENEGCETIFGHHGIAGTETGVGVINRKGAKEVQPDEFKHFKYAFFGHHHKPQDLYVGSPMKWDFGERLDDKRYIKRTVENRVFDIVSQPINDRVFKQFVFTEKDQIVVEDVKDCVIKLVFDGDSLWTKSLDIANIKKQFEKAGAHKALYEFKVAKQKKNLVIDVKDTDSHEDVIVKYAKKDNIDEGLLELGLNLFRGIQ